MKIEHKATKKTHKASHVGVGKSNRKDGEEQINVSFLQMSFFIFLGHVTSRTLKPSLYDSMAVNSPLVQIYYLHPNIIYAASKGRLITLLSQAVRHLWTEHLHEVSPPFCLLHWAPGPLKKYNPMSWRCGARGATCNLWEQKPRVQDAWWSVCWGFGMVNASFWTA